MARRSAPEVNAGSMADIAFLLLIFFLVTTTIESNEGILTMLPPKPEEQEEPPPPIKEKNIFTVLVNKHDQLLVEDELISIEDLRQKAIDFLDNGGGVGDEACLHCLGERSPSSSDNPNKAIISLRNDRQTTYKTYLAVQNELVAAYNDLRNRETERLYPEERSYTRMEAEFYDSRTSPERKDILKEKIVAIKNLYPRKLSEAEPRKN